MWLSPPLCMLLSTMLIVSAAAATTTLPNIPTTDRSELISMTDESHTNLNEYFTPTEAVETSTVGSTGISGTVQPLKKNRAYVQTQTAVENLSHVTVDSASGFSRGSDARNADVGALLNDITIAEVLVQLTRHCEAQSRTATDAALAKITAQLDTMQQFVGSIASQQQTLQTSVGSMASQQQTLQTSVGSMASQQQALQTSVGSMARQQQTLQASVGSMARQQQTLQTSVGSMDRQQQTLQTSVGLIANQQKVVLESVAYLASLQDTLQQSVGSVNQSVGALASQQQALQQSSSLLSSEQQTVIYSVDTMNKSVGSLVSDQQTLQQSIASLANQQQTLLETVLPEIATVAAQQQTALQSVSVLVTHQQSLQVSVDALQETVSSLSGQHATLQESARSSRAEVAERLGVLKAAVSRLPGRQLGDPCRNNTDCASFVALSQCGTDGVCVCAAGFRQAAGSNTRCQLHRLVGESCTADSDCLSAVAHSACGATGVCACSAGHWNRSNDECRPIASLGQQCQYNNDCLQADNHATCEGDVCQCASVRVGSYEYRLRGGGSCDRGRVELRRQSGSWGLVCDDFWDNKDADVVCRSLKYRHGTAHKKSKFGGSDNFYMDDLKCIGTEGSLLDCPYSGWGNENCGSGEVAGVTCRM